MSERAKKKLRKAIDVVYEIESRMDEELVTVDEVDELLWKRVEHIVEWAGGVVIDPCESFYSEGNLFYSRSTWSLQCQHFYYVSFNFSS